MNRHNFMFQVFEVRYVPQVLFSEYIFNTTYTPWFNFGKGQHLRNKALLSLGKVYYE
jgi:hypothetical protein